MTGLRLYPVVPGNGRTAVVDTVLPVGGGEDGKSPMFIAKGQTVQWSLFAMHRRKELYGEDALDFKPERWETIRPGWVRLLPLSRIAIGVLTIYRNTFLSMAAQESALAVRITSKSHQGILLTDNRTIRPYRSKLHHHPPHARIQRHQKPRPTPMDRMDHTHMCHRTRNDSWLDARLEIHTGRLMMDEMWKQDPRGIIST